LFSKIEPHGGKDEEGDTDSGGSTGKGAGKDAEAVLAATEEARKAEKAEKTERRRKAQGNRLVMAGVLETLLKFVVTVGLVFACFGFNYTSVRLSLSLPYYSPPRIRITLGLWYSNVSLCFRLARVLTL
jgi:hypothetical protein